MLPLAFTMACGEHVVTDEFGRTEIVLAVIDSQAAWRYREEVNAFNKDNKEYFITVVEVFRPILERDMRLWFEDETIQMIIEEEVAAYFDGHISQEKMIGNLNNRVQLYLNEVRP